MPGKEKPEQITKKAERLLPNFKLNILGIYQISWIIYL